MLMYCGICHFWRGKDLVPVPFLHEKEMKWSDYLRKHSSNSEVSFKGVSVSSFNQQEKFEIPESASETIEASSRVEPSDVHNATMVTEETGECISENASKKKRSLSSDSSSRLSIEACHLFAQ